MAPAQAASLQPELGLSNTPCQRRAARTAERGCKRKRAADREIKGTDNRAGGHGQDLPLVDIDVEALVGLPGFRCFERPFDLDRAAAWARARLEESGLPVETQEFEAAGFWLYEMGTPDVGTASAGMASRASDAATAFGKAIRWGIQLAFMLDKQYFPYDKWIIAFFERLPRLAYIFGYRHAGGPQCFDLGLGRSGRSFDNGPGMPHPPPRRCGLPGDERCHRLGHRFSNESGRLLLIIAANLADQDHLLRFRIRLIHAQNVDEACAVDGVAADAHAG